MARGPPAPGPVETAVGMGAYLTDRPGIGGALRARPEDFVVEEVPPRKLPPEGTGKYTLATVRARNWETNQLVREIARALGVSRKAVYFAGTKDKRAVTTQLFSIRAPEARVRGLDIRDVEVLDTRPAQRALKIGELTGNRFRIRVRGFGAPLDGVLEDARAIVAAIRDAGGVPNYFGIQRFGSLRPVTHVVGERIVRGDLEGAFMEYVGAPQPGDPADAREARARFEATRDAKEALEYYPGRLTFERALLHRRVEVGDDWAKVLSVLPNNLLTMFVYAYQSLLFNRIVTRRLAAGVPLNDPLPGDIVLPEEDGVPSKDTLIPVSERNVGKARAQCRKGRAFVSGAIYGYDSPLADGAMGDIERAVIGEAGVAADDFRCYALPATASRGMRRALLVHVGDAAVDGGEDAFGEYVELSFFLPKGAYATCVLREVMKSPDADDY